MITIIAKKIDAKLGSRESNFDRMDALVKYCANPQSKSETEKCVAVQALNFTDDNPSIDRIIDEMSFDMTKAKRQDVELVSHWVISWNGGEPDIDKISDSARMLLEDMGYTEANKAILAIHADTGHLHCHIVACKVDMWNGRVNPEAWYKNEAQKSLARIADKHGWGLEPGAHFRVKPDSRKQKVIVKTTQGPREYTRKVVSKCKHGKPGLAAGAKKYEHRTGLKSVQRQLQDRLSCFYEQNHEAMSEWKFGTFHRELACQGIECRRVEHKGKFFTAFSFDGEKFFPASKVCPSLAYDNLEKLLGGRRWRDSRDNLAAILDESRKRHQEEIDFLNQAQFTRAEINRLKNISAEKVYEALGIKPDQKEEKALSILSSRGFDIQSSLRWLAEKFPAPAREFDNPFNESVNRTQASGSRIAPDDLPRVRKIAEFMGAMRTDRLDIKTTLINQDIINKAAQAGDEIFEISCRNATLRQICKLMPQIKKLEDYGVQLTCKPVWSTAPVVVASDLERHFRAPDSYPLPGGKSPFQDEITLTILASGHKSLIRISADKESLFEIAKDALAAHMNDQRITETPINDKARYCPYELEKEILSDRLLRIYEQEQKLLLQRHLDEKQRSWVLASALYAAGATPGQVFTALGADDNAKKLAMDQMPASFTGQQSQWRRARLAQKPEPTLDQLDFSKDRPAPEAKKYSIKPAKEQKNGI